MTLSDLHVLALIGAAPVDQTASGDNGVRVGHVTPWEHVRAGDLRALASVESPTIRVDMQRMRACFARVFGLPERAPAGVEPILMTVAWEKNCRDNGLPQFDRDVARRVAERVMAESIAGIDMGRTCEYFGCFLNNDTTTSRPAVCIADGVAFCAAHAPKDSQYGLARMLLIATR